MDLSNLSPAEGLRKSRKRRGRGPGSGNGKTAGRGHKGQKSRSGYSKRYGFEGGQMPLHRRVPKGGFHYDKRHGFAEVNVDLLERAYSAGDTVTSEDLVKRGIAKSEKGGVKILGRGELTKKLTVNVDAISASARSKIEAVGGAIGLSTPPPARAAKPPKTKKKK